MLRKLLAGCIVGALGFAGLARAEEWPEWRGPRNDGIVKGEKILETWPTGGPTKVWSVEVGKGFASPIALDGKLYVMSNGNKSDVLFCLDAASGKTLWRQEYPWGFKGQMSGESLRPDWTGSRASPLIEGDRMYTHGIAGDVVAWDLSGKIIWQVNVLNETGSTTLTWAQASNPTIEGDLLLIQGGKGGPVAMALNKKTGKGVWAAENGLGGYAKPVVIEVGGKKQVIIFGGNALWGLDLQNGKTLWKFDWETEYDINAATPIFHDGKLFLTSAYKQGRNSLLQVTTTGVKEIYTKKDITSKYQPPIFENGYIYGNSEGTVRCVKFDTGAVMWTIPNADRIGQGGSLLRIEPDYLLMYSERGKAILARATPEKYEKLAQASLAEGNNLWATPLVYHGKMYIRGKSELACYDIGKK